jgi:hypothetical protein
MTIHNCKAGLTVYEVPWVPLRTDVSREGYPGRGTLKIIPGASIHFGVPDLGFPLSFASRRLHRNEYNGKIP